MFVHVNAIPGVDSTLHMNHECVHIFFGCGHCSLVIMSILCRVFHVSLKIGKQSKDNNHVPL